MEPQEFLISLVQQGREWGEMELTVEVVEITKIDSGLLLTLQDGSQWRLDAVEIRKGGNG